MNKAEFDMYVAKHLIWKSENARKRGIQFDLSFTSMKNLMKGKRCYYTGISLTKSNGKDDMKLSDATIDRIDPSKGYTAGNCVICCYGANQMKSQFESLGVTGLKAGRNIFDKAIKRIEANK